MGVEVWGNEWYMNGMGNVWRFCVFFPQKMGETPPVRKTPPEAKFQLPKDLAARCHVQEGVPKMGVSTHGERFQRWGGSGINRIWGR